MAVALYCRVSTDEQAEQGFSIESQKQRLTSYAQSQGWDDMRYYIDDGYSGTNIDRPQLNRLIHHVQTGKVDKVIVYRLDRLSRRQKDVLYLLEDVFEPYNIAFKSATEPFDTATPFGKAMLGILSVFAQLERDTIVERTTMGRRQRTKKGLWYGGRVPFGYDWDVETQHLTVNPQQADIIRQIYRKFLDGQSYNAIAEWASARNTDRVFDHGRIREIVTRQIYTGRMNNAGTVEDGQHEAIIDIETWERAQAEVRQRKDGKTPSGQYLLSGLLQCGICGGPMIHISMKQTRGRLKGTYYQYYVCKRQHVKPKGSNHTCTLGFKREETLEDIVVKRLRGLSTNPKYVAERIQAQVGVTDADDAVIAQLQSELDDVNKRLERWYDAFEAGTISPTQLRERIKSLEETKHTLELRIDEVTPVTLAPEKTDSILTTLAVIDEAWDDLTFDERFATLRDAVTKITVLPGDEQPDIVWNV